MELAMKKTANLKDHENKGSDEGIKLPFLHLTMPTEYLVPKPLMESHLADLMEVISHSKIILVYIVASFMRIHF